MTPAELMADVKSLVADVETDLERFGGDVEGHLRVCVAHLRAIVTEEKRGVTTEAPEAAQEVEAEAKVTMPPKGGPGSGAPAWREYAASVDVEVDEDASRDEVIEALEAASVATEAPEDED